MAGTGRIDGDDTTRWSSYDGTATSEPDGATACVDGGISPSEGPSEGPAADAAVSPYLGAGTTAGGDGVYAGAALLEGIDAKTGIGVEVMSVSGQVGAQNDVSAAEARLRIANVPLRGSATVDVFTAHFGAGTHNSDGSRGLNAGATAIAVGVEGTIEGSGWSGTLGVSMGLGGEGSIGLRDADNDGHAEVCARAVFGWWTVGGCAELPFESRALVPGGKGSEP